ncbi:protein PRRC2C-like isoform X1 [Artemia franciscana]|uniref:Uncharacterized protein n=1 Tax=Artemia franciscana TaxID=6661 RepID=A0AA88L7B3_ARTSF|nr:hypothetical protein QYM36_003372 [Artemia franciscana]KAK2721068.1 hypothetical protein QYM36_003372 [Artemia franciscana]KAK2721069.1 hypothetical protein QYM36_003372 [Artemia franciscana]KAK2721070.1 hypothetical protein QYM36_003372 [Artemia franciscana]KAK2721071.1 hypothetical protein QYM36_003372 [Artemia franciscana]
MNGFVKVALCALFVSSCLAAEADPAKRTVDKVEKRISPVYPKKQISRDGAHHHHDHHGHHEAAPAYGAGQGAAGYGSAPPVDNYAQAPAYNAAPAVPAQASYNAQPQQAFAAPAYPEQGSYSAPAQAAAPYQAQASYNAQPQQAFAASGYPEQGAYSAPAQAAAPYQAQPSYSAPAQPAVGYAAQESYSAPLEAAAQYQAPAATGYDQPAAYSAQVPAATGYDQPAAYSAQAPAAYAPAAASYDAPAPAYGAQPQEYHAPNNQGYYYYYYPVKAGKKGIKLPKASFPSFKGMWDGMKGHASGLFNSFGGGNTYAKRRSADEDTTLIGLGITSIILLIIAFGLLISVPLIDITTDDQVGQVFYNVNLGGLGIPNASYTKLNIQGLIGRSIGGFHLSDYFTMDTLNSLAKTVLKALVEVEAKHKAKI